MPLPPAEVADLFSLLEKTIRSRRLYQPNNPVYQGFIASLQRAFAALWDRIPVLTVGVEEHAFRWYGRAFGAGETRDSLPFVFYKDGIRFLTFRPGFEDEVETFFDVVNRARQHDQQGDDDMVTLLWQQDFAAFQYSYVDALAEGLQVPQSTIPTLAGLQLTLVPEAAAAEAQSDQPQPAAVQAGQPPVAGLINRDDFDETLYFLDPGELAQLRAELELEWSRDVRRDVLTALFDRLEDGLPEWRAEILRILRQMLPVYLGAADLQSATFILVELNRLLDAGQVADGDADEALALYRELSEPAVVAQLMRAVEVGTIDPESAEFAVFLRHLGPAAMPVLLAAIERTEVDALQDRLRAAMEGLASAHRSELLALLSSSDPDVLRGAARLIGRFGLDDGATDLSRLLDRPDPSTRLAAVEALLRIRNAIALDAVQRALVDPDRDVRIAAARGFAVLRYQPARRQLDAVLDSRLIRDADLTEKIAFFEAYGAVASSDSVGVLDRLLNGRRLFSRESPELRACAAMALGRIAAPAARVALQRAADDSNAVVRTAVQKALRGEAS
jgi:hypothetical protein